MTPKFISWKQPFPGIEDVANFPISSLTLRPLHGGQTSQDKCVEKLSLKCDTWWHPLLMPLMIFMGLMGAWHGVSEVEIYPIFLTILPRIGGEKNYPLKSDTWSTSNLGFFWWGRLPTVHHVPAVYQPQENCLRRGGAAPFLATGTCRGCYWELLIQIRLTTIGEVKVLYLLCK